MSTLIIHWFYNFWDYEEYDYFRESHQNRVFPRINASRIETPNLDIWFLHLNYCYYLLEHVISDMWQLESHHLEFCIPSRARLNFRVEILKKLSNLEEQKFRFLKNYFLGTSKAHIKAYNSLLERSISLLLSKAKFIIFGILGNILWIFPSRSTNQSN